MNSNLPAIGVDVGATKIALALVHPDGRAELARQIPTPAGPENAVAAIGEQINQILDAAPTKILGIGIGSPGLVDSSDGVVRGAVNLKWKEVFLAREVRKGLKTDYPVWLENDANLSAVGEAFFGSAAGCKDVLFLGLGSGLGAGVISGGRLITGAHNIAADLGHVSLDPEGRLCACGSRGCAETLLSGPGLLRAAIELRDAGKIPTSLPPDSTWTTTQIIAAARTSDPLCAAAFAMLSRNLGQLMGQSAAVVDPEIIIIGGGLGIAAADLLVEPAQREMERYLPKSLRGKIRVAVSSLTSPAVAAACLAMMRCNCP